MSSVSSDEDKRNSAEENAEDEDIDDEDKKKLVTAILDNLSTSPPAPSPPNDVAPAASATTSTADPVVEPSENKPKTTAPESSPSPVAAAALEEEQENAEPTDDDKMTMSDDTYSKKKSPQASPSQAAAVAAAAANETVATTSEEAVRENDTSRPHVLPADFEPTPAHVLCGRRKGHKDFGSNWPGNLALEQVIAEHLDEYEAASSSDEQAKLVTRILAQVRASGGGFVRISMLQDDEKKTQQRWMDIGDNARKDISAIFKLFAQARQNQMAQQKAADAIQQKKASSQRGLMESPQGKPQVKNIQLAARLQVMGHAQKGKDGFQLPSKVPTKLYVIEEKNAKRARPVPEESKRNTAMMEHILDAVPTALKVPEKGTSPYAAAAASTVHPAQFQAGIGPRAALPPAGAMPAPAAMQPLVDRPRKRVSTWL
eukprot:scaffold2438_cov167-Amphora_coffeaeformis.AAC.7